uniref:CRAL-TRIO domain-containing protein n=2 Tax=Caenorhabditis tropicalis TaxID=1561998 RepID=A0A1I7T9U9_9PELO
MTVIENDITPEDLKKIKRLRELVKDDISDYYNTDFNILRWLQGHNTLPLEEIARKMKFHLNLRSAWNLDELHKKERNHPIHKHWKYGITGPSGHMDNVIVNIEQCGKTDYTGMMETWSILEVMRARMVDLEQMLHHVMEIEAKTGKQAWILYVMDITGLQYNKKLYDLVTGSMKSLADFMADHYVEMIKYFVPVCVPSFATALYVVVRPLLPEKTREKIVKNAQTVNVTYGKTHVVTKFIKTGGKLRWWVRGNRNFGFGVFYSDEEQVSDFFIAKQVTPCFPWMPGPTLVPMEDEVIVKKDAYYHVWVSNEKSWWRTLEVQLLVESE